MLYDRKLFYHPSLIMRHPASMIQEHRRRVALKCPHCGKDGHEDGAAYCKYCGGKLVN
jgi:DNA-directed RNA polymerase subunit RPC12/RpoP